MFSPAMSEFKYACPVCGQHIKCDSSQAGTVMECPTCFQKITVPQAPADDDQKLILTGTKVADKALPNYGLETPATPKPAGTSGVAIVLLILFFMGTAAAAIYWATIIHPRHRGHPLPGDGTNSPAPAQPALVAPVANDTNWTLSLGTNTIPDSTVAGRIHGRDFIVERAVFQNGSLNLRYGTRGPTEFGVNIDFQGAHPEELAGKHLNITTNAPKAAPVTLRWKENGEVQKASFDKGYALRIEFGPPVNDRFPGKIYLCTPDAEKSYALGYFIADIRHPRPPPPQ